jgi:hypothetical protein
MNRERDRLIEDLVADLRPVGRPGRVGMSVAVWLVLACAYSLVMTLATGPIRPGALHDLREYPWFALETLFALLSIATLAIGALRSAVPGGRTAVHRLWWTVLPPAAWIAVYVVGLWHPVHPVSTLGDRVVCIWQVLLFSLPTLGLMLWFARRQFPLWPRLTGMLAGAAAAAIPAALMQFACMYQPRHILLFHIAPVLGTALLGALVGPLLLKVRGVVPRRRDASLH